MNLKCGCGVLYHEQPMFHKQESYKCRWHTCAGPCSACRVLARVFTHTVSEVEGFLFAEANQ